MKTFPETFNRSAAVCGFSILLRDQSDLRLLHAPPFWTTDRILWVGAALALILGLTVIWAGLLRLKVQEQTTVIARKIESERIAEERVRIAQELHDTLEQELAGIGIQLDLARDRTQRHPERVGESVELAIRMLRRTQQETRSSIQELRDGFLERSDLGAALNRLIERLQTEQKAPIEAQILPLKRTLPVLTEHNVLRIAQESLNNAVQHSQATRISLRLEPTDEGGLELEVKDDGKGFNPRQTPQGHFGVLGIRERAVKVGASLSIESEPGKGARVFLKLPPVPTQP